MRPHGTAVAKDPGGRAARLMKSRADFSQQHSARLFTARSKCHSASGENKVPQEITRLPASCVLRWPASWAAEVLGKSLLPR